MAFTITFPKSVAVENTRLVVLYYFITLCAIGWIAYTFVAGEAYLSTKAPNGNVQFWATNWNVAESLVKDINAQEAENPHCMSPEDYEYCDDADCSWSALKMQCIDICTSDSVKDCLETSERWVKEENGLFFPTYFSETETKRVSGPNDQPGTFSERTKRQAWHIVKGVEEMGIGFDHEYAIRKSGKMQYGGSNSKETDYGNGVLTILKDSSGSEIQRWEPGQSVELTLQSILEAGKVSLGDVSSEFGSNALESAKFRDGLLTRLGGVEIKIDLSYHNPAQHREAWKGPVAYLDIRPNIAWTSKPQLQIIDPAGSQRLRYYHGVRIKFGISGSFGWISPDRIISGLTSAMVFAGAAKNVVFMFTIYCLGVVSRIYSGYVYQEAQISHELYGLFARLSCSTANFSALKDTAKGITEKRLQNTFYSILSERPDLNSREIKRIVEFVFKGMKLESKADAQEKDEVPAIGLNEFLAASTSAECIDFDTTVDLFDADRKKTCMERFFAGPTMRKLFKSDEELHAKNENKALRHAESNIAGLESCQNGGLTDMEGNIKKLQSEYANLAIVIESLKQEANHDSEDAAMPPGSQNPSMQSLASKIQSCEQRDLELSTIIDNLQQQIKDLQNTLDTIQQSSARRLHNVASGPPAPSFIGRRVDNTVGCGGICAAPESDSSELLSVKPGVSDPAIPLQVSAKISPAKASDSTGSTNVFGSAENVAGDME